LEAVHSETERALRAERFRHSISDVDVPQHRLRRGDVVKLVDHHVAPDGTEGYSIEVFNALGDTIAVTSVPASALEALRQDEVLSGPAPCNGAEFSGMWQVANPQSKDAAPIDVIAETLSKLQGHP
jgi:hypothetical protein